MTEYDKLLDNINTERTELGNVSEPSEASVETVTRPTRAIVTDKETAIERLQHYVNTHTAIATNQVLTAVDILFEQEFLDEIKKSENWSRKTSLDY